jgi:tetratricopeptide (TPR) repeat protein
MTEKHTDTTLHLLESAKRLYYECKFEESEKAFAELTESTTRKDMGHYGVGLIHFQLGSLEPAVVEFEKCLKENSKHADAFFYLGQICRLRNELEKGTAFWLKALSLEPKHASANRQLYLLSGSVLARARRLYNQHKFKASAEAFEKVIKLGRHRAEGYYGLGVVFYQLGAYKEARKQLEACLKLSARHANAWFYLGEIARKSNALEECKRFYRKTLEINPNHAGAKRRLLNLQANQLGTAQIQASSQSPASAGVGLPSPGATQIMDSLKMVGVRPIVSAYFGKILLRVLVCAVLWFLTSLFITNTILKGTTEAKTSTFIVIYLVVFVIYLLWYIFNILSTRISLDQGHLTVAKGISSRLLDVPLANIQNLELRQSMLNRLTDDGVIVLHLAPGPNQSGNLLPTEVKVIGLAKYARLSQIVEQLKALIPLLRSNS